MTSTCTVFRHSNLLIIVKNRDFYTDLYLQRSIVKVDHVGILECGGLVVRKLECWGDQVVAEFRGCIFYGFETVGLPDRGRWTDRQTNRHTSWQQSTR